MDAVPPAAERIQGPIGPRIFIGESLPPHLQRITYDNLQVGRIYYLARKQTFTIIGEDGEEIYNNVQGEPKKFPDYRNFIAYVDSKADGRVQAKILGNRGFKKRNGDLLQDRRQFEESLPAPDYTGRPWALLPWARTEDNALLPADPSSYQAEELDEDEDPYEDTWGEISPLEIAIPLPFTRALIDAAEDADNLAFFYQPAPAGGRRHHRKLTRRARRRRTARKNGRRGLVFTRRRR